MIGDFLQKTFCARLYGLFGVFSTKMAHL